MCERCKESWAVAKKLPARNKRFDCDLCEVDKSGTARYVVLEYSFKQHFCGRHMKNLSRDLHDGLAETWLRIGLQEATTFMPIAKPAACDYKKPADVRKGKGKKCGKRARYAELGLVRAPMCKEHAKDCGCAIG